MSGYGDDYKDQQLEAFKERWAPASEGPIPEWDHETRRWWLARARAAEAQVADYKQRVSALRDLIGIGPR